MPREKSNKLLKQKLDDIKVLPICVQFDSSSAWNKLEGRLNHVTKKIRFLYYIVAASIVGVVITFSIQSEDKTLSKKEVAPTTKGAVTVEKMNTAAIIKGGEISKVRPLKVRQNPATLTQPKSRPLQTPAELEPTITEDISMTIPSQMLYVDEKKAPVKQLETAIAKAPIRKFRIVHHNRTLMQESSIMIKEDATAHHGFPLFKPGNTPETGVEEPLQQEALPQLRKKEKTFIKGMTNSLKDN